jgi:hypothetical protein
MLTSKNFSKGDQIMKTWYDVIKKGEVVNQSDELKEAIKIAKKVDAEYVMKVIEFEPIQIVWEKE